MFKKIVDYISDVRNEMMKVTWPTKSEISESTWIVLGMTLVLGVAVFVVDRMLSLGLQQLL